MEKDIHIREFTVPGKPPWKLEQILMAPAWYQFWKTTSQAVEMLNGRVLWNINSTASGGGVAEMLHSFLPYLRGMGLDARWMVLKANPEFYQVTKRIHNFLHGDPGDGGALGDREKKIYEETLANLCEQFLPLIQEDDILFFHDPQTAGMIPFLKKKCKTVIWRCHIGTENSNEYVQQGWNFLSDYFDKTSAMVFTRRVYVPEEFKSHHIDIITPSLDPFSPKNQEMDLAVARSVLHRVGLLKDNNHPIQAKPCFFRYDGTRARINHEVSLTSVEGPPNSWEPIVAQISRWDRLKDPVGVIQGFQETFAKRPDLHLVLAGPEVKGVSDDPESAKVFQEVESFWQRLDPQVKSHVHLACLSMSDLEENAAIVNALQRQASLIVQKSLQEGFGLTVTEAMWKGRPVLASKVGGIKEQIEHHKTGLLLEDPKDTQAFANLVLEVFADPLHAEYMGRNSKNEVLNRFLFNIPFEKYMNLLKTLL